MVRFSKGTTFASLDLSNMWTTRRSIVEKLWANVMYLARIGAIHGPGKLPTYTAFDVGSALAELESARTSKVVVSSSPGAIVKVCEEFRSLAFNTNNILQALPDERTQALFRPDASYLLVGGLGGIGLATASWMVDHGARSLLFANRSGLSRIESREKVKQLQDKGANITIFGCDVTVESQVAEMANKAARDLPPIRGVVQAAMVLRVGLTLSASPTTRADASQDTLIQNLSADDYNLVTQPKFQGTWNLHKHLPRNMDFFTMLSSISGVIGNASQSSYAAGNTFMDAFSAFRNRQGLPAITLDLGVITGAGYLSENRELLASMQQQGFQGTDERMLMALIHKAIATPRRPGLQGQILTGLGRWEKQKSLSNFAEALFAHFRRQAKSGDQDRGISDTYLTQEQLHASQSMDEATNVVCTALKNNIAARLGTAPGDINTSKSLSEYGVDSLVAVEMRTWIAKEMASTTPILELLAGSSLLQLSGKIASRSSLVNVAE